MKNVVEKAKGKKKYFVSAEPPAAGMEAAARINHWHEVAKQSSEMAIAAALNAGLELFKAKIDHPGTFEKWLEANCNFGRRTAYNYLKLIQQAISADELPKIANGSDKMRQDAIAEYAAETDSKSLTELYCDLGIIKKTPSKMGGKREGAGRKRKEEPHDIQAEAAEIMQSPTLADGEADDLMQKLHQFDLRGAFELIETDRLRTIRDDLYDILEHVRAVIARRAEDEK